jgi:ABC-type transporter Mla MlaB component
MIALHPATADRPAQLQLSGELTIAAAADTRAELLQLLPGVPDGPLDIHLGQVDEADTSAVQLLLSLAHTLQAQGRSARIVACTGTLRGVAQALGAIDGARCFGLPETHDTGAHA